MRAPISIVIPTLNAADALPGCVESLMEGLNAGLIREVIISDGGSTDDTQRIADAIGAQVVNGAPSRGGQLRRGCAKARGDWLLVLHADTVLMPGWADVVSDHLGQGGAACFRLAFRARGIGAAWVAGWANLRTRVFGLPYGDQGLLLPRDLYDRTGGFDDIPLMEDVALVCALATSPKLLDCVATTSAERYQRGGWLRRGARNLWTLTRYFAGVSPDRLVRAYRR